MPLGSPSPVPPPPPPPAPRAPPPPPRPPPPPPRPPAPPAAAPNPADRAAPLGGDAVYFVETGHNVRGGFLAYFNRAGGLDQFGFPRTEEFVEDGLTVQYFQRARFEFHPEHAGTPYEVELGLLGDQLLRQRGWLP